MELSSIFKSVSENIQKLESNSISFPRENEKIIVYSSFSRDELEIFNVFVKGFKFISNVLSSPVNTVYLTDRESSIGRITVIRNGDKKFTYTIKEYPNNLSVLDSKITNKIVYISREGVFPPGVPLYKLLSTTTGMYSSTNYQYGGKALADYIYNTDFDCIIDGTASVGTDTIAIGLAFRSSTVRSHPYTIYSFELDPISFKALKNNVSVYGFFDVAKQFDNGLYSNEPVIKIFNKSSVDINTIRSLTTRKTLLYYDPPWGGKSYKESDKIRLQMDNRDFADILQDLLNIENVGEIILKFPFNADLTGYPDDMTRLDIKSHNTVFYSVKPKRMIVEEKIYETKINVTDPFLPQKILKAKYSNRFLVSRELKRKELFNDISKSITILPVKERDSMLARYVFNLTINKNKTDDPVFIVSNTQLADQGIKKDFIYFKLTGYDKFILNLHQQFENAKNTIINLPDKEYKIEQKGDILSCEGINLKIPVKLLDNYPKEYLFCIYLRYDYLKVNSHALALPYENMKYRKNDNVLEAFANLNNHYFDNYCSAFSDLESVTGSLPSFWELKSFPFDIISANPPFDETIIIQLLRRIPEIYKTFKGKMIITIPDWKDFPEIEAYKKGLIRGINYKTMITKKGENEFIDYTTDKKISPCDILTIEIN